MTTRVALYSSSSRSQTERRPSRSHTSDPPRGEQAARTSSVPRTGARLRSACRAFLRRHERALWLAASALIALSFVLGHSALTPVPQTLTQQDIDAAVLHTVKTKTLPSAATRAYEIIRHSVVRVRGLNEDPADEAEKSVGSGVVIMENGTILTNFHVVSAAKRIGVVFEDGTKSEANIVGVRPEHDLAVIRATVIPDDLVPATLRSTADLQVGDEVIAVGFPFGIGPSTSSGIVSGLRREYQSPGGERLLSNLIQFDAAVNPGNSGGPLVTTDGEVVGIVTAILNPNEQPVFIGIGFAVPIENAAAAAGVSPF
ncbi:MAG TPA: trypsin-like peptidase domain-containing protein [Burkholderiales bacterium]|nr:trypsin-like peptidase domain-containing protein [Burkholderiales bacterium]